MGKTKGVRRREEGPLGDDIEIEVIGADEETHRRTVERWARHLAAMQDEVWAWCQAHPEAVEAERKRMIAAGIMRE